MRLLDTETAAAYLGVPPRFVRRLVEEKRVQYVKLGKYVRFERATLDAYVDSLQVPAAV